MQKELVIGLDIGTTSAKAVVFELNGKLIAEAEEMVETYYPNPGWAEQSPAEVETATTEALKQVIEKVDTENLLGIGISCAMHSLICLDEQYNPLSQMLIWSDTRSSELAEEFMKHEGKSIYARTGTPIHPMSPLMKLMWMKENNYKPYEEASYFMTMKEYLLYKWYRKKVIDYSMASSTGLMNVSELDWDKEALELVGIKHDMLSTIVAPTEVLTGMSENVANYIGIAADTPMVIGAADGQLANLGSGAISPGEVNVSVGTSGAIRQFVKGAPVNEKMETFTYAFTADTSIIGGPTNNGGVALQWFKDILEFNGSHDELLSGIENVSVGSEGIIFLPYINGERAPLWNGRAKGNFYGLSINHKREHLTRAVLEGITFNIYNIGKSLESIAGKPEKITVNGGLSKSTLWVQIMADVFGQEIYVSDTHHNAAWGAAWTALVGTSKVDSFEQIKSSLPSEKVIEPNMDNHQIYLDIFGKYVRLSENIESFFSE